MKPLSVEDGTDRKRLLRNQRRLANRIYNDLQHYLSRNNSANIPMDSIEVIVAAIRKSEIGGYL